MSSPTILVIDDSATIRRLADHGLASAGYRVVLASNAEDGVKMARTESPDLILLDHQLPGTTGFEVCGHLLQDAQMSKIPVILSSTLRKQAYIEYAQCSNVIDMLPKPYNEELLKSTVEHALQTGNMVVDSQTHGTAVPEVINQVSDAELSGNFLQFSPREVLDFLNNGLKSGVLEVQAPAWRAWFYLSKGRIQAVTANGVDAQFIMDSLPESLSNLGPVVKLAISGRSGSELDGLVQLLNNKVLDSRLLRKLLRHQASMLAFHCFTSALKEFRFEQDAAVPPLFSDLPLDTSLAALLVEGALRCEEPALPRVSDSTAYVRKAIRGQNLDRAGMSASHQRAVTLLAQPHSAAELAKKLSWDESEAQRVLHGLALADLLEAKEQSLAPTVLLFEPDNDVSQQIRDSVCGQERYQIRVVRDRLSIQLVVKRDPPNLVVLPLPDTDEEQDFVDQLKTSLASGGSESGFLYVSENADVRGEAHLNRPYSPNQLLAALDEVFQPAGPPEPCLPTDQLELATGTGA